ncbi:MAG: acetoacetate decarboxylase family protein [Coriobacteriia bacterium]|nr:acetoacetate decarboxylase family protein [Coriobacteriia bacterium]
MTTFQLSPEEFARQYADDGILKNGLVMDDMEGIWLAWATDPAAVQAMLPPAVEFAAPVVLSYIVKADTKFAGTYNEAAMIIPCVYQGKPSAILQSLLLCGPGAYQALYFGREMAGMPKKICDDVIVELGEETASATIVKSGVEVLKCQLKIGEYNTPAGNEMFGANVPGQPFHQDSFLMKFNLEQYDDGHIGFENGRMLVTENDTCYEYWKPATAEIQLTECADAPWASLPVAQVLAAGVGKYSMYNFITYKIGEFDAEENAPYLLRARFDSKLLV